MREAAGGVAGDLRASPAARCARAGGGQPLAGVADGRAGGGEGDAQAAAQSGTMALAFSSTSIIGALCSSH